MKEKKSYHEKFFKEFDSTEADFEKWDSLFFRLGLKPRRYGKDAEAVYICTVEGWFRLSKVKYEKEELNWVRNILQYLEERSFNNWAEPWQKTIIWEEKDFCYLIQPWDFSKEYFFPGDPGSIKRIAEILADLYRCGKDYRENKGIEINRDRWSAVNRKWDSDLKKLESLKEESFHEKIRKEIHELKKDALNMLNECSNTWKTEINDLFDHHAVSGVIGHGKLLAKYIIWRDHDYYLLNWEDLSFQPKIADLASLINDVGLWEPEWIIRFVGEYSKIQSFWPEEYNALKALLLYPERIISLLGEEPETVEYKQIKEVMKEMKHKEHCLGKVWRELGATKRWNRSKNFSENQSDDNGKISLVLSPIETWGGFNGNQFNSLIQLRNEQKLPNEIFERLINQTQDRVFGGGREGNIMAGAANVADPVMEIVEEKPKSAGEEVELSPNAPKISKAQSSATGIITQNPPLVSSKDTETTVSPDSLKQAGPVISWRGFPKSIKRE